MDHTITREQLSSLLASANPPLLLEALPAKYFDDAHLPGARNMPHDAVTELAPQLAPDKTAPIVVYCANAACQNSHIAAERLTQLGYADVRVYAGGKKDWQEAGLAVERGSTVTA
jgi:rhodanese-related sulfurtransferase